jgi:hypothetical protein
MERTLEHRASMGERYSVAPDHASVLHAVDPTLRPARPTPRW